jgi:hypothetical protein
VICHAGDLPGEVIDPEDLHGIVWAQLANANDAQGIPTGECVKQDGHGQERDSDGQFHFFFSFL